MSNFNDTKSCTTSYVNQIVNPILTALSFHLHHVHIFLSSRRHLSRECYIRATWIDECVCVCVHWLSSEHVHAWIMKILTNPGKIFVPLIFLTWLMSYVENCWGSWFSKSGSGDAVAFKYSILMKIGNELSRVLSGFCFICLKIPSRMKKMFPRFPPILDERSYGV